jgi:LysM repeat protein
VVDPDRLRVWVARLAAPLAFFFAATVLVILVQRGLESDEGEAGSGTVASVDTTTNSDSTTTEPDGTTTTGQACLANRTRVQEGETLEAIAARCEVPVDQIIALNPGIDPLALTVGQKVRIRPPGAQP